MNCLDNFCTAKDKQRRVGKSHRVKKASKEMTYAIPHSTRSDFGVGSLRADYCCLPLLHSAALPTGVLAGMIAS